MKYDVDLQEMDSRLDARGTCTEESAGAVEGNEKKNGRQWVKRREKTREGEKEREIESREGEKERKSAQGAG